MKNSFVVVFISFSLFACKTNQEIIGFATNAKDGASIRTEDAVFIIDDLRTWADSINNKNVQAKVKILNTSNVTKSYLYNENTKIYKQGRIGKTIEVKLLTIKIIK
jgi:hypothetical protein